jgi:hypothetical protein
MGAVELKASGIFWKINLDKIIETDKVRCRVMNAKPNVNMQE